LTFKPQFGIILLYWIGAFLFGGIMYGEIHHDCIYYFGKKVYVAYELSDGFLSFTSIEVDGINIINEVDSEDLDNFEAILRENGDVEQ